MVYYTVDKSGKITAFANWKFKDACLESEREIVRGHDDQFYFADEIPMQSPEQETQIITPEVNSDIADLWQAMLDMSAELEALKGGK